MSNSMFDQFKLAMKKAIQDEDFRRKNQIYQDDDFLSGVLNRVDSLTNDVTIEQDYNDIISVLGMVKKDTSNRSIVFDTRGFKTTLSAFREGLIQNPSKIWRRIVEGSDDRYLISDRGSGVLVLNSDLEVLYRFPNFSPNVAGGGYHDASACVTFVVDDVEYIAITMYSHHVCSIYEYNSPNTFQSTIGQVDTPGDITDYLNNPIGIAVDETNSLLYILSQDGQPAGSTLNRGFVSVYDVSTPSTPVFQEIFLYYANTGSLLDAESDSAKDVYFDDGILWVSNGGDQDEVAGIDVLATPHRCVKYIEPSGSGYTLRSPEQVSTLTDPGNYKSLFIANGATGTIEEFDAQTLRHQRTFGFRASEDELNSYYRLSDAVYGAIGYAKAAIADNTILDEKDTKVLLCTDTLNKRMHSFNVDAYTTDNFVNFSPLEFEVPFSANGWTVSGTIPMDMLKVYYRFQDTEEFREMPPDTSLPETSRIQFQLRIQLDSRRFVRDWYVSKLRVHGNQV